MIKVGKPFVDRYFLLFLTYHILGSCASRAGTILTCPLFMNLANHKSKIGRASCRERV